MARPPDNARREIAAEAAKLLAEMEAKADGQSALFSLLGHKGDLMLVHFRESFDQLNQAELDLARLRLNDFLEPTTSYLSVIELGLYESSLKTYKALAERGVEPHSEEWKKSIAGNDRAPERSDEAATCFRRCRRTATSAFIRWIGDAAKTRTGTRFPWKNASAR